MLHGSDFAQHHIDSLDLSINAVAWLAKQYPGKSEQEYRAHLGAFGITVRGLRVALFANRACWLI